MASPAASSAASADGVTPELQARLALYGVTVRTSQEGSARHDSETPAASTSTSASASASAAGLPASFSARGRSLVALQDYPAGSIVLQSTPHSFVLMPLPVDSSEEGQEHDPDAQRRKCEHCGRAAGDAPIAPGAKPVVLLRCSRCHVSSYCSQMCQRAAWKSFHAFECKHLWSMPAKRRTLAQLAPEAQLDLMLLARCVRKRMKETEAAAAPAGGGMDAEVASRRQAERDGSPLASELEDLSGMESHLAFMQHCVEQHGSAQAKRSDSCLNAASVPNSCAPSGLTDDVVLSMAQRLSDNTQLLSFGFRLGLFGPSVNPSHVPSLLLPLLTAFQSNNFAITSGLLTTAGAGVYPLGALLNHSCDPNCCVVYEERLAGDRADRRGREWTEESPENVLVDPFSPDVARRQAGHSVHVQSIRTLRAVRAGEELCHSFIDTAAVTRSRREQLYSRYYFTCRCERCEEEGAGEGAVEGAGGQVAPPWALEHFLERDIDGNQLPDYILSYETEEPAQKKESASVASAGAATSLPPGRAAALLRANQLWQRATDVHMAPNTASTPAAFQAEEDRRTRQEQSHISGALSIRLQHLHPYALQLLSSYSKLLHACLLNGDYPQAIHACEQLCMKYRVVYGSRGIREEAMARCARRRLPVPPLPRAASEAEAAAAATLSPSVPPVPLAEEAEEDDDADAEAAHVSDYRDFTPHALLGLQLYTLGSLYAQAHRQFLDALTPADRSNAPDNPSGRLAQSTFRVSLAILRVTHGARHPLVRQLQEEMRQAAAGAAS